MIMQYRKKGGEAGGKGDGNKDGKDDSNEGGKDDSNEGGKDDSHGGDDGKDEDGSHSAEEFDCSNYKSDKGMSLFNFHFTHSFFLSFSQFNQILCIIIIPRCIWGYIAFHLGTPPRPPQTTCGRDN